MGTVSGPEEEATKASKPVVGSAASSTMDLHATLPFASCPSAPGPGMPTGWGETEAGVLSSPPVGSALLDLAKSHPAMISVALLTAAVAASAHASPFLQEDCAQLASTCSALEAFLLKSERLKDVPGVASAINACLKDALTSVTEMQAPGNFTPAFLSQTKLLRFNDIYTRLVLALRLLQPEGQIAGFPPTKAFSQAAAMDEIAAKMGGANILKSAGDKAQFDLQRRRLDRECAPRTAAHRQGVSVVPASIRSLSSDQQTIIDKRHYDAAVKAGGKASQLDEMVALFLEVQRKAHESMQEARFLSRQVSELPSLSKIDEWHSKCPVPPSEPARLVVVHDISVLTSASAAFKEVHDAIEQMGARYTAHSPSTLATLVSEEKVECLAGSMAKTGGGAVDVMGCFMPRKASNDQFVVASAIPATWHGAANLPAGKMTKVELALAKGDATLAAWLPGAAMGQDLCSSDPAKHAECKSVPTQELHASADVFVISVPILVEDQAVGALSCTFKTKPADFSPAWIQWQVEVAARVGAALAAHVQTHRVSRAKAVIAAQAPAAAITTR